MDYLIQQRRDATYDIIDVEGRVIGSAPHANRAAAYAAIDRLYKDRRKAA
jgi:hypothetical protein